MRSAVTAVLFSTLGLFMSNIAAAHQECVSTATGDADPFEVVDVAHVTFSSADKTTGKVDLYSFYAGELFNGTWDAIAGGHVIALSLNVRFQEIQQSNDTAKNSNLLDATSGKLLGSVRLDGEKAGSLTITREDGSVRAFNLECKDVVDAPATPAPTPTTPGSN